MELNQVLVYLLHRPLKYVLIRWLIKSYFTLKVLKRLILLSLLVALKNELEQRCVDYLLPQCTRDGSPTQFQLAPNSQFLLFFYIKLVKSQISIMIQQPRQPQPLCIYQITRVCIIKVQRRSFKHDIHWVICTAVTVSTVTLRLTSPQPCALCTPGA